MSLADQGGAGVSELFAAIDRAVKAGDLWAASELADVALARGAEHPGLLHLSGWRLHQRGDYGAALDRLSRARALAPADADVLNSLGLCLHRLSRTQEAIQAYDGALAVRPAFAQAFCNKGSALRDSGDLEGADRCFEQAIEIAPNYAEPLAALAAASAARRDLSRARELAEKALSVSPKLASARLTLAEVEIAECAFAEARARLQDMPGSPELSGINRAIAASLLGDALDGLDRPQEAFDAYAASKQELRALYADQYERPGLETALQMAERLERYFTSSQANRWSGEAASPGPSVAATHVFLVGFPRSGTTLLEQVLASHPDVVTLEERECLAFAGAPLLSEPGGLDRLATLDEAGLAERREAYWAEVRRNGVEPAGRVFVDKMPLNSVLLPIAARLFPQAKILWARRDPRDVVLSCFRRRFGMTASMYQLTTLQGAADYYDAVMRLNEAYARTLVQDRFVLRYEDFVRNFEPESRRVCEFIGLPWLDTLKAFAETARRRSINTPSAPQVARGLFTEGVGQWRRYGEQLRPARPILDAWAERFGYPAD